MQSQIIEQLHHKLEKGKNNVLIRQSTGTGKTFALTLGLLTLAIEEHRLLRTNFQLSEAQAFKVQQINSLVVVPNRELAFQIEEWANRLLTSAYPELARQKVLQRFVSGAPYEGQQRGVLRRHGMPAIIVGTPRSLLEQVDSIAVPEFLQLLKTKISPDTSSEELQRLVDAEAKHGMSAAGDFTGLRRLVIDEIDGVLKLPGKHATEKQRLLRKDKPTAGQVLVDGLMDSLGIRSVVSSLRPADGSSRDSAVDTMSFARPRESRARGWHKRSDVALAQARKPLPSADCSRRLQVNIAGPRSLQLIVSSATANRSLRGWLSSRGWLTCAPHVIDNDSGSVEVPLATIHHCLVIEHDRSIRNLRLQKAESADDAPAAEEETKADRLVMEQMAEVASTVIRELRPAGPVIVFMRSDASSTQFGYALEAYGVRARDIMTRFDAELGSRIDETQGGGLSSHQPVVYLATEEAARGIDVPDTALVLILDAPRSPASYAHLSGRTGRFGRPGTVVSVVPVGRLGWHESKMRGIFSALNIRPQVLPFVQD
ncbi:hypothetical protein GGI04_003700 [Coemansia thaxteri]|nr:hypothetical protein GGI04_003700 [Coemansia thaxteri]KAJ2467314.1 hypothetical protein GGI02_004078 [Coemansia sp. RSA 2322]KAJ2479781.1 hypothetical protein EV174_003924 [Coemansia sp. RSA 2320]